MPETSAANASVVRIATYSMVMKKVRGKIGR